MDPEVAAQYHLSETEFQEMQENNEESWTNCFVELKPSGVLREINNEDPLKKSHLTRDFSSKKRGPWGDVSWEPEAYETTFTEVISNVGAIKI